MKTLRILVVEDEYGMRLAIARALRDYSLRLPDVEDEIGFTIDQAEGAEQALVMINEHPPDLLLLDYKLPGMSGLDLLGKLSSRQVDMLTIMITAYASIETAVTATKRGAFDFRAKPFTPVELKETIYKATKHLVFIREAHKLSEEKRKVRFQFITVLAHEMKAPLAALDGYLQIMKERAAGDKPEVYDHMVERCLTRVMGMRKMIADLLDLTCIESGERNRELTEVDVREVAQAAIDTVMPEAQQRSISIALDASAQVHMQADRSEIEIILNNLVTNAVKYNRDGGSVDVRLQADDGKVTVSVLDTGIGMAREEAERLFKDFVRIKNEKTRNILGSGLGLSTVKKIALLYGGEVTVESEPDAGSTFTVTLNTITSEEETVDKNAAA
ncbi:MAG: ATP-binding protein [Proteobacteria bacterium]|nr:ATP-binding protein [Pseudomonadota bacterium]